MSAGDENPTPSEGPLRKAETSAQFNLLAVSETTTFLGDRYLPFVEKALGRKDVLGSLLRLITAALPLLLLSTILFSFNISGVILSLGLFLLLVVVLIGAACVMVGYHPSTPPVAASRARKRLMGLLSLITLCVVLPLLLTEGKLNLQSFLRGAKLLEQDMRVLLGKQTLTAAAAAVPYQLSRLPISDADEFRLKAIEVGPQSEDALGLLINKWGDNNITIDDRSKFLAALTKIGTIRISGKPIDLARRGYPPKKFVLIARKIEIDPHAPILIGSNDVTLIAADFDFGNGSSIQAFDRRQYGAEEVQVGSGESGRAAGTLRIAALGSITGKLNVDLRGEDGDAGKRGDDGRDGEGFSDGQPPAAGVPGAVIVANGNYDFWKYDEGSKHWYRDPVSAEVIEKISASLVEGPLMVLATETGLHCTSEPCVVLRCAKYAGSGRPGNPGSAPNPGAPGGLGGLSGRFHRYFLGDVSWDPINIVPGKSNDGPRGLPGRPGRGGKGEDGGAADALGACSPGPPGPPGNDASSKVISAGGSESTSDVGTEFTEPRELMR